MVYKDYWVFGLVYYLVFFKKQKQKNITFQKDIQFPKRCVPLCILEYQMIDKSKNPVILNTRISPTLIFRLASHNNKFLVVPKINYSEKCSDLRETNRLLGRNIHA
jgi:hypothetical protein